MAAIYLTLTIFYIASGKLEVFVTVILWVSFVNNVAFHVVIGGFAWSGGALAWGVLITGTSALVLSRRHTAALGGSYLLAAVILAFFEPNLQASRQQPAVELTTVVAMDMFVASLMILIPTIVILVGQMVREQVRANSLLLNVLPKVIADRLKESPGVIADSFEDCTVLFADLVGFTEYAATVAPERLVAVLNLIFSRFDELVGHRGAEKIKTIGDGYLVIAGAPEPRPDHVTTMCQLALEMQETIGKLNAEQGSDFRLRIGLNTGPVVAGVIGESRFSYDLWGDTVNLASRMQSRGQYRPPRRCTCERERVFTSSPPESST
ncbi:MAG TPA: adenylate/guanylate cyclase domain-containing protein [Acidimicrobiia bacterium]